MTPNQPQEVRIEEPQEIRIEDYFWIILRSKWSILAILVVATLTALLKTDLSTPMYQAKAKVWLQEDQQQAVPFADLLIPGLGRASQLETYREIILARPIVAVAVRELRAEGFMDPLPVHRAKSVLWLANLLGIQLPSKTEVGELTIEEWEEDVVEKLMEDWLKADPSREADIITIRVQQRTPERARDLANKVAAVFQRFIRNDMQKRMQATETFATIQLQSIEKELNSQEELLRKFQEENQTINLDAEALMIIDKIGQLDLQKTTHVQLLEGAKARLEILTTQLNAISLEVISAETLTDNPIVTRLNQQLREDQIQRAGLEGHYPTGHSDIKILQARIEQTEREIAAEDLRKVTSQTTSPNPTYELLQQQTIQALAEIRQVESQLRVLDERIKIFAGLMEELPAKQLKLARLKRNMMSNQELFTALEATRQEAAIVGAAEIGSVKILEWANAPDDPIQPRPKLNIAIGMLIGLAFGFGLAFVKNYFDDTYSTLEDALRQFETLPQAPSFLGVIPSIEGDTDRRIALMAHDSPKSGVAEAFRIMRTKLQFLTPGTELKTILVTSSTSGEGKSTISSNLAVTLAQMEKKVLLVDADMRRPSQHKAFPSAQLLHTQPQPQLPSGADRETSGALEPVGASSADLRKPGLSELLVKLNQEDPHESLYSVTKKTEVDNLFLISSGTIPPNPVELLNSDMMSKFIEIANKEYDVVVIDSPPSRAVADPIILSTIVDAVIHVFDITKTRRLDILTGLESLAEALPKKIGVLCNMTSPQHGGYYGYGRYSYSKYGLYGRYRHGGYYYYYNADDGSDDSEKQE